MQGITYLKFTNSVSIAPFGMKKIGLLSLILFVAYQSKAQEIIAERPAKAIYLEALGSGLGLSVNYDTRFKPGLTGWGVRGGIGGLNLSASDNTGQSVSIGMVTLPILANYVAGNSIAAFEAGAGLLPAYVNASASDLNSTSGITSGAVKGLSLSGTLNAGLRLQPRNKGVHFRLYWAPLFNKSGFYPKFGGLSLGYGFRG